MEQPAPLARQPREGLSRKEEGRLSRKEEAGSAEGGDLYMRGYRDTVYNRASRG